MAHTRGILRGAVAGAAGTTALNAVTCTDMAVRGRSASDTPEQVVRALASDAGTQVPGGKTGRGNRVTALGALTGLATGTVLGSVTGLLRSVGVRLPTAVGGPLLGVAAMVATDLPVTLLGVSNPRTWTAKDWVSDVVPHVVYGITTHAALVAAEAPVEEQDPEVLAARRAALGRGLALGAATGGRSSAGITAVALTTRPGEVPGVGAKLTSTPVTALASVLAATEQVLDKLPRAPSRVAPTGLAPRVLLGGLSAALVAQRDQGDVALGAVVGAATAAAAAAAARAGLAWRGWAAGRFGSDRPGALLEDGMVVVLGWLGARRP